MRRLTNESRLRVMSKTQEKFIGGCSPRRESGRLAKTREQVVCDVQLLESEAINSDAFSIVERRQFCTRVVQFVLRHEPLLSSAQEYCVIRGRLRILMMHMQEVIDGDGRCMGTDRSKVILGRLFAWCLFRLDEADWRHSMLSPKDVEMVDADSAVVC